MFHIDFSQLIANAGEGVRFLLTGCIITISLWVSFQLVRFLLIMNRFK